uniref:Uncharacterized protein n=1 Tax=Rhizophora mucronata TaxID=61149 RepID=A0A2P2N3J4_RHIMU
MIRSRLLKFQQISATGIDQIPVQITISGCCKNHKFCFSTEFTIKHKKRLQIVIFTAAAMMWEYERIQYRRSHCVKSKNI